MKAKILLLSLAMLLLGGRAKARTNQQRHFIYFKNPRAWKKETSL